jgi:hypothetical protein
MNVEKQEWESKLQVRRELVGFVKEIVALTKQIENRLPPNPQLCAADKLFFFSNFLHRNADYGNNVVALVNGKHSHAAVLVARTIFEGVVYVESYRRLDESLARKWCYYFIYEVYRVKYERDGKPVADKWLNEYKQKHDPTIVEEAQKEFDFDDRKQNWHKKLGKLSNLFEKLARTGDPNLVRMEYAKRKFYDPFSKVTHWTPQGVRGAERFTLPAIALTFESLHWVSKAVNDDCHLDFKEKLDDTWNRYQRYSRATLEEWPFKS